MIDIHFWKYLGKSRPNFKKYMNSIINMKSQKIHDLNRHGPPIGRFRIIKKAVSSKVHQSDVRRKPCN